ncbi:MAG: hypothetical protein F6K19_45485 [Cyanothece sp. SIO1E1]|nr:hypothetical protein [Cyanothece sp. SIO1E1]
MAAIAAYEEEQRTPYITPLERNAIQRGLEQGILRQKQEDILEILQLRFGESEQLVAISEAIAQLNHRNTLSTLFRQALAQLSLDAFEQILSAILSPRRLG